MKNDKEKFISSYAIKHHNGLIFHLGRTRDLLLSLSIADLWYLCRSFNLNAWHWSFPLHGTISLQQSFFIYLNIHNFLISPSTHRQDKTRQDTTLLCSSFSINFDVNSCFFFAISILELQPMSWNSNKSSHARRTDVEAGSWKRVSTRWLWRLRDIIHSLSSNYLSIIKTEPDQMIERRILSWHLHFD